ncbi:hypothetical protein NHX12_021801 [Muraenolepis orangiensis]|uniref:SCAN box domain-containing protein n=1 Tax=Muraenolepis orangiensis TaxID=630683 RepID=A0A9Q0ISP0_9TELE|nr:hypothetical protein NHX12_021801 [Muraenolepis orangiensis]
MNPDSMMNYILLKQAVLRKYEINAETYRQQFRSLETDIDETLQELYVRLKDIFCKWVVFDKSTKEYIMEAMVLEQFLRVLLPEVKTSV